MDDDAGLYGRSFADVYDSWYDLAGDTAAAVDALTRRCPPPRRLLDIGTGTGRLALPLAELGYDVTGVDTSSEMLAVLVRKARSKGSLPLRPLCADARTLVGCDDASADLVLAGLNMVFNLVDDGDLGAFLRAAARVAAPGGQLVVQMDRVSTLVAGAEAVSPARVDHGHATVTTRVRPDGRVVDGIHQSIDEHGRPVGPPRPWSIRPVAVGELDDAADSAGWTLADRSNGWNGEPADATDLAGAIEPAGAIVSWYVRRSPAPPSPG